MTQPVCISCREKDTLLSEYVTSLGVHNRDLRNYLREVGGALVVKTQAEASRAACHVARQRYADHVREHGC